MKLVKASNGKTRITLSKKEWKEIGKTAGWINASRYEDSYKGHEISIEVERDPDNIMIWHWVKTPEGERKLADISSYGEHSIEEHAEMVKMWIDAGYPSRQGIGALKKEQLQQMLNDKEGSDEFKKMRSIKVIFEDGRSVKTSINGTRKSINEYYLGKEFNFGDTDAHPKDNLQKAVKVEFLD